MNFANLVKFVNFAIFCFVNYENFTNFVNSKQCAVITYKQDEFQYSCKLFALFDLFACSGCTDNVWFAILHQLRIALLKHQRFESRYQSFDTTDADGKLFSFGQVIILRLEFFQPVKLVWSGDVLDQGLEEIFSQDFGVASQNAFP